MRIERIFSDKGNADRGTVQMSCNDLRPFCARVNSFIVPNAISVLCQLLDHRIYVCLILVAIAYKDIFFRTHIGFYSASFHTPPPCSSIVRMSKKPDASNVSFTSDDMPTMIRAAASFSSMIC